MQPVHSFPVYIIIVDNNSEYFTFFIFSEENHLCKSKTSIKSFKTCLGVLWRRRSKISCLVAVNKSCAYDLQAKSRSMVRVWLNNVWLIVRSACASERTALIILSLLWVMCWKPVAIWSVNHVENWDCLVIYEVLAAELIDPNRPAILLSRSRFERAGGIWTASLSL